MVRGNQVSPATLQVAPDGIHRLLRPPLAKCAVIAECLAQTATKSNIPTDQASEAMGPCVLGCELERDCGKGPVTVGRRG